MMDRLKKSGGGASKLDISASSRFSIGLCGPRFAFTLAEVLITLAIIGVVAAMTLPAITAKIQDRIYQSHYNKAKNILTNGYKLMSAHNDNVSILDTPMMSCNDIFCFSREHKDAFKILRDTASGLNPDTLPEKYAVEGEEDSPFSWDDVPYIFQTTDGMTYGVDKDVNLRSLSVFADVNTNKNPNKIYKDMYKFRVASNGNILDVSSELDPSSMCDINHYKGCKTAEACSDAGLAKAFANWNGYGEEPTSRCYWWHDNKCNYEVNSMTPSYCR